jgi:N-acetylglutamate synthase
MGGGVEEHAGVARQRAQGEVRATSLTARRGGVVQAASALATTWQHLFGAVPNGWVRREGGVVAAVSGVALSVLNGVWAEEVDPDDDIVAHLIDQVASTGLPYCLQLRPGSGEALANLAARRGMVRAGEVPLMVLEDAGALAAVQEVDGLLVRQLSPEEARAHATVAASGFEVPEEPFLQLMTPAVLRLPGVQCYIGVVDGQPVTTGLGVSLGPFVGVFNVATPPAHRGRGFGAAVTARTVADGLAKGALWSWLQSSSAGYGVYTRLGFRTVEQWDCWVSPG